MKKSVDFETFLLLAWEDCSGSVVGKVLDSRLRGCGLSLTGGTAYPLLSIGSTQEDRSQHD